NPLRVMKGNEVVNHRGSESSALRRKPPVAEVEDVESASEPVDRHAAEAAPHRPQRVRGGNLEEPALDVDALERTLYLGTTVPAHERAGDDFVTRAGEADERSADVVADAGARMRQRRDVDDDPHAAAGTYSKPAIRTPRRRGSPTGRRTGAPSNWTRHAATRGWRTRTP